MGVKEVITSRMAAGASDAPAAAKVGMKELVKRARKLSQP